MRNDDPTAPAVLDLNPDIGRNSGIRYYPANPDKVRMAVNLDGFYKTLHNAHIKMGPWTTIAPNDSFLCTRIETGDGRRGSIIISQAPQPDGHEWIHASINLADGLPTYPDLVLLHRAVFGRRRWAYQVFAPDTDHINLTSNALHLWARVDGANVLPDFGRLGTI